MTKLFGVNAGTYDPELGEFISDSHVHLAAVIHDYKPTLSLVYIPKKDQTAFDKPWAIIEKDPRFGESIIRYLSDAEMQSPSAVLAWLFNGDQDKQGTINVLQRIENEATAQKLLDLKRQEDELEDAIDHMQFYLSGGREKKHTLRMGKGKTIERG